MATQLFTIKVLYEDKNLIFLFKPPYLHTEGRNSLAVFLNQKAYFLNRLDFETSGIVVLAKDKDTLAILKRGQKNNLILKSYLALVQNYFSQSVKLETYIGGRYRRSKKVTIYKRNGARRERAITFLTPVKYFAKQNISLVKADIYQGKRHQIRAHLAYLGFPIVGDPIYFNKICSYPFFLHCFKTEIDRSLFGKKIRVIASPVEIKTTSLNFIKSYVVKYIEKNYY